MSRLRSTIALTALLALSASAVAQGNRRQATPPHGLRVPDGMCRVWIDGLSLDRQPAPTNCATARANAGANARVIYGRNVNTNVNDGRRVNRPWDLGSNTGDSRRSREMDKAERKREREIEKANRKRDKEWNKGRKHGDDDDGDDEDDDRDEDRDHRGHGRDRDGDHDRDGDRDHDQHSRRRGDENVRTCIDANGDGRCDNVSTSTGIELPNVLRRRP